MIKTFSQFINESLVRNVVVAFTHEDPSDLLVIENPSPEVMTILDDYNTYGWHYGECAATTELITGHNNDESIEISPVDATAVNFRQVLSKQCQECLDNISKDCIANGWDFEGEYECEDVPLIGYMYMRNIEKYNSGEDLLNDILEYIDQTEVDRDSMSAYWIIDINKGEAMYGQGVNVDFATSDDFLAMYAGGDE